MVLSSVFILSIHKHLFLVTEKSSQFSIDDQDDGFKGNSCYSFCWCNELSLSWSNFKFYEVIKQQIEEYIIPPQ